MAFSSVLQMYLGWANSLLCEQGVLIDGLHQLRDGNIFCQLIELLTGTQLISKDQDALVNESLALDNVQTALDYLAAIGVKIAINAEGVVHGELKSILDVLWSIILHCTIHSPERAAYQRTVRIGRKLLLQWCGEELDMNVDTNKSMASIFSSNNCLSDLLALHCSFENDRRNPEKYLVNLTNGILAAEDHFGLSKTLLGPAEVINGTSDEHSLMIYLALLRRKVRMLSSRRCSISSDEDEFIKISPTKQSPNSSILSVANSVYSERSSFSTNHSQLSTLHPPHHRYAPDFPLTYKPPSVESSPNRTVTTAHDITPEKSDSGISVSTDAPSSSSSGLPSLPPSRLKESRESRLVWQTTQGPAYAGTPSKTTQGSEIPSDGFSGYYSSRRIEATNNDKRWEAGIHVNSRVREVRHPTNVPSPSEGNLSGRDEGMKQAEGSLSDGQVIAEEMEVHEAGEKKGEHLVGNSKDRDAKEAEPVRSPDDELLHLLDTIGKESQHLRLELNETQEREAILKTQLEEEVVGSTKEEQVISKLIRELEMLRTENRQLFRESANAKNTNAVDRKTIEKLNATIGKLQMEIEHQSAENFNLKMKSKAGSSVSSDGPSDHSYGSRETSELCDLKRDLARAEAQKEFLQTRLTEMEEETKRKLNETSEVLRTSRLESLRLEKECKLLRMSSETSRLEVETVAGRCRRLEEYLSYAQKRNNRLAQQIEDECLQASSQNKHNQSISFVVKLEEENTLLKQKVELAEEERKLLKQELAHYRLNKTTLDEVLRAWDVQTSSKFQSFLDDFRLHINEKREHQETKTTKNPEPESKVKDGEKQTAPSETLDQNDISTSARSSSSDKSESSSHPSGRWKSTEEASREPVLDTQKETKPLTAENLAAIRRSQSVVDDKYLQVSPRRIDTDTEVDSEMDSQSTDGAFCDLPNGYSEQAGKGNQMVVAGGISKTKIAEGFRRPSLGDLIVAKSQNSPPNDKDAYRNDPDRNRSQKVTMEVNKKSLENDQDAATVQGENTDAPAASDDHSQDLPPRSLLSGRMRFSAVHSSLESLREITKKAKLKPNRSPPGATEETSGYQEPGQNDEKLAALGEKKDVKAGGDNQESLANGDVKITNGYSLDSRSLPEREPSTFQIHQRVGPGLGRLPRWRRMQNRSQPTLDGSYLEGCKAASHPVQDTSSEQKQDWRNRSSSLGSPLNSKLNDQEATSKHSHQSKVSETGMTSLDSEEEYASLPERRNVAQDLAVGHTGPGEDLKSDKLRRDEADGNDDSGTSKNLYLGREESRKQQEGSEDGLRSQVRVAPLGSASKPQFSSPQRLGFLRSKLGIKLERELLHSSSSYRESLNEGATSTVSTTGDPGPQLANGNHSSEIQPTNQSESLKSGPTQPASTKNKDDTDSKSNIEGTRPAPVSNKDSPDISKLSPASYSQYYKHKMMTEKDQEYANSIIDKYLNNI